MKPELEQVELGGGNSILAFHYANTDFDAPWHFHPQYELTYIRGSIGTRFIGDFVGPYEPGEWVLLGANLPHCWKNHEASSEQAQSTVIQWNNNIFPRVPELMPLFDLLKTASRGIAFQTHEVGPFVPMLEHMPSLQGPALYLELLTLLLKLSACTYSTLSESRFDQDIPPEFSSRMARIHDFVAAAYSRKIYLRELADLVSMSEQSFSRFFSKMMGRPFFTFLNEYRINVAGRMLIDTDWSITQIGYACGYESLPFFYKQFYKFKQESPSRFRKKHASGLRKP